MISKEVDKMKGYKNGVFPEMVAKIDLSYGFLRKLCCYTATVVYRDAAGVTGDQRC